jgi:hypothetical protein
MNRKIRLVLENGQKIVFIVNNATKINRSGSVKTKKYYFANNAMNKFTREEIE